MVLNFDEMDLKNDKKEINDWGEKFRGTDGWKRISDFVLEHGMICDLDELIETNYEIAKIGEDERKLAISIKNKYGEIVAFVICQEFNLTTDSPELFIQYVTVRPDKQGQGIGRKIYHRIPREVGKLTGKEPTSGFAVVSKENSASLKLFEELGFKPNKLWNGFVQMVGEFKKEKEKNDTQIEL